MVPLAEVLGESSGLKAVREQIRQLLERRAGSRRLPPILVHGETGTGKGLVARGIHSAGPRASGPFVHVNCAAIPEHLLEAELFGFERGAFTDAKQAKPGLFHAAHRGTLFLDEVGLLPEGLQGKLLTVVEEQAVRRLGSTRSDPVDVWILAANSEDLKVAIRAGRFREDLYHRLALLTLWLPPLRERGREDILLLAEHFMMRACADYGLPPKVLAPQARAALAAYRWPGNIRELANVIERVALLSDSSEVTAEMLGLSQSVQPQTIAVRRAAEKVEPERLVEALRQTEGNIARAAARLGISRNTLRYRIEKHELGARVPARLQPAERAEFPLQQPHGEIAPAPAGSTVVRWERRRLTLLRVYFVTPRDEVRPDTSHALEEAMEKVRIFGGRVEELSPTGLVATFGLDALGDAAPRAALAAKAILKAAQRTAGTTGQPTAGKLAIHVAELLVGQVVGSAQIELQGKLEAYGALEALTKRAQGDSILVSAAAAAFLERRFELVGLEAQIYQLSGREPGGAGERLGRFVGRRHEVELLRERFVSASAGRGQVAAVVGEAGIGKSRLLLELRQALAGQPLIHLQGRCVSYGSTIPYFPILDLVRVSCGITDADSPEATAQKTGGVLAGLGMALADSLPYLLHLLGLQEGARSLAALEPDVIKSRTLELLRQMTLRMSERHPLIMVVEDLHWGDKASEDYLASLVDTIAGASTLLVFSYRPGYQPPWMGKSYATQIALQPLPPEDSASIVRGVLGSARASGSVVERIVAKAAGNPFFLEELARTVQEQAAPALTVPDTIQEAILARINLLPLQGKQLVQAAAVIGPQVSAGLLAKIVDLPEGELRRALMDVQTAEILYDKGGLPEPAYTFKHALTQETVYERLLPEQRRALHARIVEAIERLNVGRLGEHVEHLAHHALNAALWTKAVAYLRQAGAKAAARSAHLEAAACYEQALAALVHLPESRERMEQAIDLRFELRTPLHLLGEFERMLGHLREAQALADSLGEPARQGWVYSYLMQYFRNTGDQPRAMEAGQRALAVAEKLGDFALQVTTNTHLGVVYGTLGDYRQAARILRGNVVSLSGACARDRFGMVGLPAALSGGYLGWYLAETGAFEEAVSRTDAALKLAESANDPYSIAFAATLTGLVATLKGTPEPAIPVLERALALCRGMNFRTLLPSVACWLGAAYALAGRCAEAISLIEESLQVAVAIKRKDRYAIFLAWLAEAQLRAGHPELASQPAERALQFAREQGERGHEAYALRLLADIATHLNEVKKAETVYREAMALAEELGMRPLVAHCLLGLSRLYIRVENRNNAEQPLAAAAALYREMNMPYWLAQIPATPQ